MAKGSSVQVLFELCKKTFIPSAAASPSSHLIKKLASLMDAISPEEVGFKDDNMVDERGLGFFGSSLPRHSNRAALWAQPITYVHIYECESFQICMFCLPTVSTIPLHDHPGMTVLSKILYGSMHVKSYDWVEPVRTAVRSADSDYSSVRLAKLQKDTVLSAPCPTTVLFPATGGNLHCFTAATPCAVLDVLAPPYSEAAGRSCTYYHDYPYSSFMTKGLDLDGREEDHAWLEVIEDPDGPDMRSGTYAGPAIQDHA